MRDNELEVKAHHWPNIMVGSTYGSPLNSDRGSFLIVAGIPDRRIRNLPGLLLAFHKKLSILRTACSTQLGTTTQSYYCRLWMSGFPLILPMIKVC